MKIKFLFFIFFFAIFSYQKKIKNKKTTVNIAFSINNKYINWLYITLYSLFENSNNNTIYHIYIQVKNNFEKRRKELIYNLEKKYFNCFIHFINMKRDFKNVFRDFIDISAYYRLKLPISCPNLNRIIHIDADTLILKDLTELYSQNFEGNIILGKLDQITSELDSLGIYTDTYINSGLLLMDLYSLRKYNYVEKFMNYIYSNNNRKYLLHHDQTVINFICYDKIGLLNPKYNMWPFGTEKKIIEINNNFRKKYDEKEFIKDYYNPYIIHFPGGFKKKMNKNTAYKNLYNKYVDKIKEIKFLKLESLMHIINYSLLNILLFCKIMVYL